MNITIKVKFKNVELEMTPEEAKELVKILEGVTGGKITEYIPYYPYYPSRWYPNTWETTWTKPPTIGDIKYVYNVAFKE